MTAQHQQIEGMLDGVITHGAGDLLVLDDLQAHPDVAAGRDCLARPFEAPFGPPPDRGRLPIVIVRDLSNRSPLHHRKGNNMTTLASHDRCRSA